MLFFVVFGLVWFGFFYKIVSIVKNLLGKGDKYNGRANSGKREDSYDNIFFLDVIDHVQIMSTPKGRQNLVKYCVRRACDLRLLNTTALLQSIIIQKEGDSVVPVSCCLALGWKGGGEEDQSRLWDERRLSHFHKEDCSNTCFDLLC